MENSDTATEPKNSDGIFRLRDPKARENGESVDISVQPSDKTGYYAVTVNMDTHLWGGWDDEEEPSHRLACVDMCADGARKLARKLTLGATRVDELNGVQAGVREDLSEFLESLDPDGPIWVRYDAADSVFRWGDLKSILY